MRDFIQMSEDGFDATYPLVTNHLNLNASWTYGDGPGCMFETYGQELDFVRQQDRRRIWTIIDGQDDDLFIVSGYHLVNRIGYLISTVLVPVDTDIQVHIPRDPE